MATLAPERFLFIRGIGSGGQASVQEWEEKQTRRRVAAKVFSSALTRIDQRRLEEAQKVMSIIHPCIVGGIEMILPKNFGGLFACVMELGQCSLKDAKLDATGRCLAAISIVKSLAFLHEEQGLLHSDVKPENLIVMSDGVVKLADLSSRYLESVTQARLLTTLTYEAPELGDGAPLSFKCDVYSIGLVFYFLVAGKPAYDASKPRKVLERDIDGGRRAALPADTHPVLVAMINRCCSIDPAARPTMSEVDNEFGKVDYLLFPGADPAKVHAFLATLPPGAKQGEDLRMRVTAAEQAAADFDRKSQQLGQRMTSAQQQAERDIARRQAQRAQELEQLRQQMTNANNQAERDIDRRRQELAQELQRLRHQREQMDRQKADKTQLAQQLKKCLEQPMAVKPIGRGAPNACGTVIENVQIRGSHRKVRGNFIS
jgi:hypothetical protein